MAVQGGSELVIKGKFGEVAYPDSAAPLVRVGVNTTCTVDLIKSSDKLVCCTIGPISVEDLAGRASGRFTLEVSVSTWQVRERTDGSKLSVPVQVECQIPNGCHVQFDLDSQPSMSSLRTPTVQPNGLLRFQGSGLDSDAPAQIDNEYEYDPGVAGGWGGSCTCPDGQIYQVGDNRNGCISLACNGGSSGGCNRLSGAWSGYRVTCGAVAVEQEQDGQPTSLDNPSVEVRVRSVTAAEKPTRPAGHCMMRDYGGKHADTIGQNLGAKVGPSNDQEASCTVSSSLIEQAHAGFFSIEVRQSRLNKGFAKLNESDSLVDLVSGQRYHFELTARIASVTPAIAPIHGGIPLTVHGIGFGTDISAIDARLGRTRCQVIAATKGSFTCYLNEERDQFAAVANWEWPSERGARWQWYYLASLGIHPITELSSVLTLGGFPDFADGEMLIPMAQVVRRWSNHFVSRVSGWFVAPSTADYEFYVRADDAALFYLNKNDQAIRPNTPLINLTEPVLQWTVNPQSGKVPMLAGKHYWFELLCARTEEYNGFGTPEDDSAVATSALDGYRMGRCDFGMRVHAPAALLPDGEVRGAVFETHQIVLMSSLVGFTELSFDGCAQWVTINHTIGSGRTQLPRVAAAMSSTYSSSYTASVCIDDYIGGDTFMCHTRTEDSPWLRIDLGSMQTVGSVLIYNRNGVCGSRLGSFELWLETASGNRRRCAVGGAGGNPGTTCSSANVPGAGPLDVPCTGEAQFVEVVLPGAERVLNLREVLVFSPYPSAARSPPTQSEVEQAVRKLIPTALNIIVSRTQLHSDQQHTDAYQYNVTIRAAGTHGMLRARNYGIEWHGVLANAGGVDVLPVTGDMLIAPSLKRRPALSVRLGDQTTATCGAADWGARHIGCYVREKPRSATGYENQDEVLRINETVITVGGMTLERCSMHCEARNYSFFSVSRRSGLTDECGCLDKVDPDEIDRFVSAPPRS